MNCTNDSSFNCPSTPEPERLDGVPRTLLPPRSRIRTTAPKEPPKLTRSTDRCRLLARTQVVGRVQRAISRLTDPPLTEFSRLGHAQ